MDFFAQAFIFVFSDLSWTTAFSQTWFSLLKDFACLARNIKWLLQDNYKNWLVNDKIIKFVAKHIIFLFIIGVETFASCTNLTIALELFVRKVIFRRVPWLSSILSNYFWMNKKVNLVEILHSKISSFILPCESTKSLLDVTGYYLETKSIPKLWAELRLICEVGSWRGPNSTTTFIELNREWLVSRVFVPRKWSVTVIHSYQTKRVDFFFVGSVTIYYITNWDESIFENLK